MAIFHLGIHRKKSEFWGDFFPPPPTKNAVGKNFIFGLFRPKIPPGDVMGASLCFPTWNFLDFREFPPSQKSLNFSWIFLTISKHQGGALIPLIPFIPLSPRRKFFPEQPQETKIGILVLEIELKTHKFIPNSPF